MSGKNGTDTMAPADGTNPRVAWHMQTKGAMSVDDRPGRDITLDLTAVGRLVDAAEDWAAEVAPQLVAGPRRDLLTVAAGALRKATPAVWGGLADRAGVATPDRATRAEVTDWLASGGCAGSASLTGALAKGYDNEREQWHGVRELVGT